jgi:hypothetical protein
VLAQILDYADVLQMEVRAPEICELSGGLDSEEQRDQIEELLQTGDFLLVVCGDRIQSTLVRLMKPMADRPQHATSRFNVAMVSLALYAVGHDNEELILVPNIVGVIERAERALELAVSVRVRNEQGQDLAASVTTAHQVRREAIADEAALFGVLDDHVDPDELESCRRTLRDILERAKDEGFEIAWSRTKKGGSPYFMIQGPGSGVRFFTFYSDGWALTMRRSFAARVREESIVLALTELFRKLGEPYEGRDDNWVDPTLPGATDAIFAYCRTMRDVIANEA